MFPDFLWIYQTDWQKSILARYGNISLIDATYKTTNYDLALFFVRVRTNVGFIVVGQFITQSETTEQIQEALQILQTWNPEWRPRYFMCDYSEAELAALEAVFPGVTVCLCDFHRKQAWERWTNERSMDSMTKEEISLSICFVNVQMRPPLQMTHTCHVHTTTTKQLKH